MGSSRIAETLLNGCNDVAKATLQTPVNAHAPAAASPTGPDPQAAAASLQAFVSRADLLPSAASILAVPKRDPTKIDSAVNSVEAATAEIATVEEIGVAAIVNAAG